ncbi:MAG: hypothetical protein IAG13_09700 [Deltaproteobacteria bacterium]|nr:hypothetical protein [Nannocystaceae bacterium]
MAARAHELGRAMQAALRVVRAKHDEGIAAVLGPVPSPIERIDRRTRWQLLIRARERGPMRWMLGELRPRLGADGHGARATVAMVDVDPQSML